VCLQVTDLLNDYRVIRYTEGSQSERTPHQLTAADVLYKETSHTFTGAAENQYEEQNRFTFHIY